jgi:hypothetical protein
LDELGALGVPKRASFRASIVRNLFVMEAIVKQRVWQIVYVVTMFQHAQHKFEVFDFVVLRVVVADL